MLLAYGTHHIPPASRSVVVDEAFRVIEPGGVFVLHDFPAGSPVDTWFAKVVDAYSITGHDHRHFESEQTVSYLRSAGFVQVEVQLMEDPFVVYGPTAAEAELELGRYLVDMYGLVALTHEYGPERGVRRAFELARDIFQYGRQSGDSGEVTTAYDEELGQWRVTMPREALVGIGCKEPDL